MRCRVHGQEGKFETSLSGRLSSNFRYSPRWVSKLHPPVHIYEITRDSRVMRRLQLLWGFHPIHYGEHIEYVDDQVREAVRAVYAQGLTSKDKDIVFTSGTRNTEGKTNIGGIFHVKDLLQESKGVCQPIRQ